MAAINWRRVHLGTLAGGAAWTFWSLAINMAVLRSRYPAAQAAGQFLKEPRYPLFVAMWILTLFILSSILSWLYASVRATLGPGPRTALTLEVSVGFVAGFPLSFAMATWGTFPRVLPLWWMLELWVGAILATFFAGWVYKD